MTRPPMTRQTTSPPRRALAPTAVLLGAAGWLAFVALTLADLAWDWPGLVSLVVLGASWFACRTVIGDIAERRADEVDEYELGQRNAARNAGYVAALGSLGVLYVLATVALRLDDRGHPELLGQLPPLVFAALLLAAATPSFLLAWQLRRRSADPDDEGEL
ncbi:hypothetical protein [Nocardioides pantholopis]|uniref:hypothetical protein n=1 Tax=Nocardioides pantholopis TaxID=2483798 RepID=UPI000FD76BE7|nr:hypothetical protein [Nocardioides pantholopis]